MNGVLQEYEATTDNLHEDHVLSVYSRARARKRAKLFNIPEAKPPPSRLLEDPNRYIHNHCFVSPSILQLEALYLDLKFCVSRSRCHFMEPETGFQCLVSQLSDFTSQLAESSDNRKTSPVCHY